MIFKSMVYDPAFSGIEAAVLSKVEMESIERAVLRKARALLKSSGWMRRSSSGREVTFLTKRREKHWTLEQ